MAKREVWHTNFFKIDWVGEPPEDLTFDGPVICKSYDLKIITSGLLVLRGKEGVDENLHLIPPSAYTHVEVSVWDENEGLLSDH
jgi:hypothetical protein